MNNEYEKIEFKTWQELAKFVIDSGEVYALDGYALDGRGDFKQITFSADNFKFNVFLDVFLNNCYTKKQKTIEELIAIKPRLCRVWDDIIECKGIDVINRVTNEHYKFRGKSCGWKHAEMLTDDEIKEFLNDK